MRNSPILATVILVLCGVFIAGRLDAPDDGARHVERRTSKDEIERVASDRELPPKLEQPLSAPHSINVNPVESSAIPISPAELQQKLLASKNWKAFVEEAISIPEAGGRALALWALNLCSFYSDGTAKNAADVPKWAADVIQADEMRCANLDRQTIAHYRDLATARDGRIDPYLRTFLTGMYVDAKEALQSAAVSPILLTRAVESNFVALQTDIFGAPPNDAETMRSRQLALAAALCEIRDDCVNTYLTAIPCATSNLCGSNDFRVALSAQIEPGRVDDFKAQVDAVRAFLRPYKTP